MKLWGNEVFLCGRSVPKPKHKTPKMLTSLRFSSKAETSHSKREKLVEAEMRVWTQWEAPDGSNKNQRVSQTNSGKHEFILNESTSDRFTVCSIKLRLSLTTWELSEPENTTAASELKTVVCSFNHIILLLVWAAGKFRDTRNDDVRHLTENPSNICCSIFILSLCLCVWRLIFQQLPADRKMFVRLCESFSVKPKPTAVGPAQVRDQVNYSSQCVSIRKNKPTLRTHRHPV